MRFEATATIAIVTRLTENSIEVRYRDSLGVNLAPELAIGACSLGALSNILDALDSSIQEIRKEIAELR